MPPKCLESTCARKTVKARSSLRVAYLISDTQEGGLIERRLIRRGALFTKSNAIDMYDDFSILLLHILRIQKTIVVK